MIYHLLEEKKNVKDARLAFCEEGIQLGSFLVVQRGEIFHEVFPDCLTCTSVAHSRVGGQRYTRSNGAERSSWVHLRARSPRTWSHRFAAL